MMPFLILIVFVMVCLGLFWHDRSVLASCAAELAGKGAARKYETDAHLESWLTTEAAGLVEGRLYLSEGDGERNKDFMGKNHSDLYRVQSAAWRA